MAQEAGAKIGDLEPVAELVDCTPPELTVLSVDVSAPREASPVQQAMTATLEQTGADPPPVVMHG